MRRLSQVICYLVLIVSIQAQSPHGNNSLLDCAVCHNQTGWTIEKDTFEFKHDTLGFALEGQHLFVDCRLCHTDLIFNPTPNDCMSCHLDVHSGSVGNDCARCHNSDNWLVDQIPEIHEENGFTLIGAHATLNCVDCHQSEIQLRFDRIGNDCINCHLVDFSETTSPNHNSLGFSQNCIECHNPSDNSWETNIVEHDFFPLIKGHEINDCNACHLGATLSDISPDCISCHQNDFNASIDPNHTELGLSNDCLECHTTDLGWAPASFDIHNEIYPLKGAHAIIANECIQCHADGFANTPTQCIGCHQGDFNETDDPDHVAAGFPTDCLECHTEDAWTPANFDHDAIFQLNGAHAVIANECIQCHADGFANTPSQCIGCHQGDFNETDDPDHIAAGFPTDCLECHTEDVWTPANFDHDAIFQLNGAHAVIANECIQCHADGFANTPSQCIGCHQGDFNETDDPDHVAAGFPTDCLECHTEDAWTPANFDHDAIFQLNGAHAVIANECIQCHADGFANTPSQCIGCHQGDFNETDDPDHIAAGFPTDCLECHTEDAWTPANFDHDAIFQLNGAHAVIANECIQCHADGFANTPSQCIGCHQGDFNETDDPDHVAAGFPTDCLECHTEDAWTPANFDHDAIFQLNGAHAIIANECIQCHADGFANTPSQCIGCHQGDFNETDDPDHIAAGFPTDCLECHTEDVWTPANFDHDAIFQLNGAHAVIANECIQCHADGFANTPSQCIGCHQGDFNETDDPDHVAAGFPTDCLECHTEDAWTPANFDHDAIFQLNGAHAVIANECIQCHADGFANTPSQCIGCHQGDFNETDDPDHIAAGFPTDCLECHTEDAWTPANFDHDAIFQLNGAHAIIANECIQCHADGFANTPTECIGCHQGEFNETDDPDHIELGFPTDCLECHTESAWMPADFNHDPFYVLTGAHGLAANNCTACHADGFANTPTECVGCHLVDYNSTVDPNHRQSGFPTDCQECHSDQSWTPANINHDLFYPLTGAHALVANNCTACHEGGFANTPTECIGCHQADYNNTTDPNHRQSGFPINCEECHSVQSWTPAQFDHDAFFFPINSGKHQGEWNNCTDCHISGSFSTFSCIACHEHSDREEVDEDHEDVPGYQYQSNACLSCHPTGDE